MRGVFLGAWLVPLIELVMLTVGQIWYRTRFEWTPWKFSGLVIQITTTGREEVRVNQIISEIRTFRLSMPYQIWVVNEPGLTDSYPRADRVLTVPADFHGPLEVQGASAGVREARAPAAELERAGHKNTLCR